ncbi:Cdc2-related protein kinase [Klebsormidium nitens]|uniref:[RNA-polymerase]-subunit kinase n=1 Tax=Klebsormidium nitens TaxID=105231 RepID=A0A1Y1IDD3_KLENI|nr:Cdc2-related protein kinase [Klebsormidium nitens]|eukprot:GAQ86098.1 Cdc2-related protein kinase [Klebsormidium nitens]
MALAKDGQLNLEAVPSEGVRSSDCFTKLEQIGEGTYGQVYKARDNETSEIVALKKVRMDNEKEGFPITAIREIKILKKLNDDNIVKLKEIVTQKDSGAQQNKAKGSIYMVFEYMDHDLTGLTDRNDVKFALPQIKCYLKQLLTGLHFCHTNQVLHRDIKGSNLLINNEGILKLADFGLARNFSSDKDNPAPLTNRVITLWYRPPELLLGATKYGPAIDMWSVGCIFAELLYGKPILPGKNEVDQFQRIMELCGSPTEENWPGYLELPWAKQWTDAVPRRPRKLRHTFRNFSPDALELVERLLTLDPEKRGTAAEALDAEFFWTPPLPCDPKELPQYEASHEYQTKKRRQQARQQQDDARHRPAPAAQQGQHPPHAHPPARGSRPPSSSTPRSSTPPLRTTRRSMGTGPWRLPLCMLPPSQPLMPPRASTTRLRPSNMPSRHMQGP